MCEIIRSKDATTRVRATGELYMMLRLQVSAVNGELIIRFTPMEDHHQNYNSNRVLDRNRIIVELPCETGNHATISVNGMGTLTCDAIPFRSGNLNVNGSGDIKMRGFEGTCTAKINGSGDIAVNGGSCEKFDVEIHGSGDIDATKLTARNANIILHNNGTVTLGRVLHSSTEQIKKKGKIRIIKRGAEN